MTTKKLTKADLDEMRTLGTFNPVGYAVLAFADDGVAGEAKKAFVDAGFAGDDILQLTSGDMFPEAAESMRESSGAAGFGYEITLLRRYMTLASEGVGWLLVHSPGEEQTKVVQDIARRLGARSAVQYGRLLHEDLV